MLVIESLAASMSGRDEETFPVAGTLYALLLHVAS